MSARDALFNDIWDMRTADQKNALIDAHRDEAAQEIGRDALRDGLVPTLIRLVGEENAAKLMADLRDAHAHELAEQQRAWLYAYADEFEEMPKNQEDITELIDLIDPARAKGAA